MEAMINYVAPTMDFYSTTLKGQVSATSSMIALASIGPLQVPGYIVIDRTTNTTPPNSTPSIREVIAFGSIASINILTGLTRGADQSTAGNHSDGALVETVWTTGMWNSLVSLMQQSFDKNGLLLATPSLISIQGINSNNIYTSIASIAKMNITTRLDVSSASVTGFGFIPVFCGSGAYSGPTTAIGGLRTAPRAGTLKWISALTRYVASGTSVGFDFKVRGTSVFANATTQPAIGAGGTYVSTASIATLNINAGDLMQADVSSMLAGAGLIQEISILGGIN